jgi:hypothetical protein
VELITLALEKFQWQSLEISFFVKVGRAYGFSILCQSFPPKEATSLSPRVSFETSFQSKQPKLEPKLVSALSETKRFFSVVRFYTETESFNVLIEPKQAEDQRRQLGIFQKI